MGRGHGAGARHCFLRSTLCRALLALPFGSACLILYWLNSGSSLRLVGDDRLQAHSDGYGFPHHFRQFVTRYGQNQLHTHGGQDHRRSVINPWQQLTEIRRYLAGQSPPPSNSIVQSMADLPQNTAEDSAVSSSKSQEFGMEAVRLEERQISEWDLRELLSAWNGLHLGRVEMVLRIAGFVRKWPSGGTPGGLERHAFTLYQALAQRGHEVHVFTLVSPTSNGTSTFSFGKQGSLSVHSFLLPAMAEGKSGSYNQPAAWDAFLALNSSRPFDIVHTESVALHHSRARFVPNLIVSWHGIAFETIHSDIVTDLTRPPDTSRSQGLQQTMSERLFRVSDEIRFFSSYHHHVAISDYVGEVLRIIYEVPTENVHVIFNGVDDLQFRPRAGRGAALRKKVGIAVNSTALVLGVAGRLVKDKGHPLLIPALTDILGSGAMEGRCSVYLLVAGDGPWATRYQELSDHGCVKVMGAMAPTEMSDFYNAVDIFVNPTLRAQGLDLTLLEAMACGKPVLATRFASITRSVVRDATVGYTFSPNVPSLVAALRQAMEDGKDALVVKGEAAHHLASQVFTSSKMALAYERLFLCACYPDRFCRYPLKTDLVNTSSPAL